MPIKARIMPIMPNVSKNISRILVFFIIFLAILNLNIYGFVLTTFEIQ